MRQAKGWTIFWIVYMLFFAIGLPLIIYGGINSRGSLIDLSERSPYLGLGCLALGSILWLVVIIVYAKKFLLNVFAGRRNAQQLIQTGTKRKGRILRKEIRKSKNGNEYLKLKVEFENFSHAVVAKEFELVDVRPMEMRFEEGKSISLLLDPQLKPPYVSVEPQEIKINGQRMLWVVLGLIVLIALALGLLVYSYTKESHGYGWRYLQIWHPFIIIPGSLIFYYVLMFGIMRSFFKSGQKPYMLLYGKKTEAQIDAVSQTGTYINEQPQVLFQVSYRDDAGRNQTASYKKIVSLLEIGSIGKGGSVAILYDPKDPSKIEPYNE